jgi:hypothetical protein
MCYVKTYKSAAVRRDVRKAVVEKVRWMGDGRGGKAKEVEGM